MLFRERKGREHAADLNALTYGSHSPMTELGRRDQEAGGAEGRHEPRRNPQGPEEHWDGIARPDLQLENKGLFRPHPHPARHCLQRQRRLLVLPQNDGDVRVRTHLLHGFDAILASVSSSAFFFCLSFTAHEPRSFLCSKISVFLVSFFMKKHSLILDWL